MVFEHDGYKLYKRDVQLKNTDKTQTIYFFSKKKPKSGEKADLPEHLTYGVNSKTGFHYVKRKK